VVIVGVDEPMIKEWITDRELLEVEEGVSVDAESLAAQIGVLKAIKDYDLKRLITFHVASMTYTVEPVTANCTLISPRTSRACAITRV